MLLDTAPVAELNVPATHRMQVPLVVIADPVWYVPPTQAVHVPLEVAPDADEYVPGEQEIQLLPPLT